MPAPISPNITNKFNEPVRSAVLAELRGIRSVTREVLDPILSIESVTPVLPFAPPAAVAHQQIVNHGTVLLALLSYAEAILLKSPKQASRITAGLLITVSEMTNNAKRYSSLSEVRDDIAKNGIPPLRLEYPPQQSCDPLVTWLTQIGGGVTGLTFGLAVGAIPGAVLGTMAGTFVAGSVRSHACTGDLDFVGNGISGVASGVGLATGFLNPGLSVEAVAGVRGALLWLLNRMQIGASASIATSIGAQTGQIIFDRRSDYSYRELYEDTKIGTLLGAFAPSFRLPISAPALPRIAYTLSRAFERIASFEEVAAANGSGTYALARQWFKKVESAQPPKPNPSETTPPRTSDTPLLDEIIRRGEQPPASARMLLDEAVETYMRKEARGGFMPPLKISTAPATGLVVAAGARVFDQFSNQESSSSKPKLQAATAEAIANEILQASMLRDRDALNELGKDVRASGVSGEVLNEAIEIYLRRSPVKQTFGAYLLLLRSFNLPIDGGDPVEKARREERHQRLFARGLLRRNSGGSNADDVLKQRTDTIKAFQSAFKTAAAGDARPFPVGLLAFESISDDGQLEDVISGIIGLDFGRPKLRMLFDQIAETIDPDSSVQDRFRWTYILCHLGLTEKLSGHVSLSSPSGLLLANQLRDPDVVRVFGQKFPELLLELILKGIDVDLSGISTSMMPEVISRFNRRVIRTRGERLSGLLGWSLEQAFSAFFSSQSGQEQNESTIQRLRFLGAFLEEGEYKFATRQNVFDGRHSELLVFARTVALAWLTNEQRAVSFAVSKADQFDLLVRRYLDGILATWIDASGAVSRQCANVLLGLGTQSQNKDLNRTTGLALSHLFFGNQQKEQIKFQEGDRAQLQALAKTHPIYGIDGRVLPDAVFFGSSRKLWIDRLRDLSDEKFPYDYLAHGNRKIINEIGRDLDFESTRRVLDSTEQYVCGVIALTHSTELSDTNTFAVKYGNLVKETRVHFRLLRRFPLESVTDFLVTRYVPWSHFSASLNVSEFRRSVTESNALQSALNSALGIPRETITEPVEAKSSHQWINLFGPLLKLSLDEKGISFSLSTGFDSDGNVTETLPVRGASPILTYFRGRALSKILSDPTQRNLVSEKSYAALLAQLVDPVQSLTGQIISPMTPEKVTDLISKAEAEREQPKQFFPPLAFLRPYEQLWKSLDEPAKQRVVQQKIDPDTLRRNLAAAGHITLTPTEFSELLNSPQREERYRALEDFFFRRAALSGDLTPVQRTQTLQALVRDPGLFLRYVVFSNLEKSESAIQRFGEDPLGLKQFAFEELAQSIVKDPAPSAEVPAETSPATTRAMEEFRYAVSRLPTEDRKRIGDYFRAFELKHSSLPKALRDIAGVLVIADEIESAITEMRASSSTDVQELGTRLSKRVQDVPVDSFAFWAEAYFSKLREAAPTFTIGPLSGNELELVLNLIMPRLGFGNKREDFAKKIRVPVALAVEAPGLSRALARYSPLYYLEHIHSSVFLSGSLSEIPRSWAELLLTYEYPLEVNNADSDTLAILRRRARALDTIKGKLGEFKAKKQSLDIDHLPKRISVIVDALGAVDAHDVIRFLLNNDEYLTRSRSALARVLGNEPGMVRYLSLEEGERLAQALQRENIPSKDDVVGGQTISAQKSPSEFLRQNVEEVIRQGAGSLAAHKTVSESHKAKFVELLTHSLYPKAANGDETAQFLAASRIIDIVGFSSFLQLTTPSNILLHSRLPVAGLEVLLKLLGSQPFPMTLLDEVKRMSQNTRSIRTSSPGVIEEFSGICSDLLRAMDGMGSFEVLRAKLGEHFQHVPTLEMIARSYTNFRQLGELLRLYLRQK